MPIQWKEIDYSELNGRQKENYNFMKVSAVLADFGFVTMRLSDDWQGADFIAQHIGHEIFLKVQLKSRLTFDKKYEEADLYVAFPHDADWYLYPHKEFLEQVLASGVMGGSKSWESGNYSFPKFSEEIRRLLE